MNKMKQGLARTRRSVRNPQPTSSSASSSPRAPSSTVRQPKFARYHALDTSLSTSSLTAFKLTKEITQKELQNERIAALTVCKNLIYLATKSGRLSIFEEINTKNLKNTKNQMNATKRSFVKHKKSVVMYTKYFISIILALNNTLYNL